MIVPQGSGAGSISKIEYSTDNGKKWSTVTFTTESGIAKFSTKLASTSNEGAYVVLWRARDSKTIVARGSHLVVIDKTAPKPATIISPRAGGVLTDKDDTDSLRAGLQFALSGGAEPGASVMCSVASVVSTSSPQATIKVTAAVDGHFTCSGFTLSERGSYTASVVVTDVAGNTSASVATQFVYDNPPSVTLLDPKPYRGFAKTAEIRWRVSDIDDDLVKNLVLEYRKGDGAYTKLLVPAGANSYTWDVTQLAPGSGYELRLEASDGIATGADQVNFSIDRGAPAEPTIVISKTVLGKSDFLSFNGRAGDALSGIEYVEYAITPQGEEGEKEWFAATVTSGFLSTSASYTAKYSKLLSDGMYQVYVRAVDAAGNISPEASVAITVDSNPPRVGSFAFIYKEVSIPPDTEGKVSLYAEATTTFAVSLEGDAKEAVLLLDNDRIPLVKNIVSGLWEASVAVSSGTRVLRISATDEVGNSVMRKEIGILVAIPRASVVDQDNKPVGAVEIKILEQGLVMMSDAEGTFELALPAGHYTVVARKAGYQTVVRAFVLERASLVTVSLETKQISGAQAFFQSIWDYFNY